MAMTVRLPDELDAELRIAAAEDRRSLHQEIVCAVEMFLAQRETAAVLADPDALRSLAEAREAVRDGDLLTGTDAVWDLVGRSRVG